MPEEAGPSDDKGAADANRERVLASLLDATRELMIAGDAEAICQVAVDAANDRLGYELVGAHLHPGAPLSERAAADDAPVGLESVAWTDALVDIIGQSPPPTIEPGVGVAWESFEEGTLRVYDDLRTADAELMDPDTAFRSELHVPLGRHGLLIIGSAEVDEFDAEDIYFARILAANTTAALDNLASRRAVERREQELARQNRRLEEFAGVISHDLRNPLAIAQASLQMALEDDGMDELERTRDALDRMESLVDGLLTLAREGRGVGDISAVDIVTIAERAWTTVDTGDARLETEPVPELQADPDRLQQLLENLFRNSVEHGADATAALTVTVGPLTAGAGFYVADDGSGIPDAERESVFEHGVSTAGGTGLGLTIVRTIAEAHGWTVAATESDAGGARFEFRIGES
ncbi:sensor histidine kinase [Haloglomus halophilum]|uniref:sensor histidine kinase n=1 Tax=Haloglomus halophilum TaxID=2962672 RepID=UPI0020C9448F|nr:GAF domain-containing sensor histidine kinase [Haloglomus halophilum]